MPDVWKWFSNYAMQISLNGTQAHRAMFSTWHMSTLVDTTHRLSLLRRTRDQAATLNETCFYLFLSHWITEHLLWHARDYDAALKNALDAVVKLQTVDGACPLADRVYINLVEAYTEIDPAGYREDIERSLAYVRDNVPIDYESHCMMAFRRGLMHVRLHDWAAATAAAQQCLSWVEGTDGAAYYRAVAHYVLGWVAFHDGTPTELHTLALAGQDYAQTSEPAIYLAEFLLWEAWALLQLGDGDAARARYLHAVRVAQREPQALTAAFYDAQVAWALHTASPLEAIRVRETQLERIATRGAHLDETEAALSLVSLQKRAAQPTDTTAARARAAAARLRNPAPHLATLAGLLGE